MDHIKVLKRAWETTWRYRALWIFGIIIALTTASAGGGGSSAGGSGGGNDGNGRFQPPGDFPWPPSEYSWSWPEIPSNIVNTLIVISVGAACVITLLVIVGTIARYVAETALIRMVDEHEETGEQRSVRKGFRMGWSRTTFRLFLISLLIGLPTKLVFILLFALTAVPLLLWTMGNT
ncbi:MAG: hypothetical protein V3S14_08945, partial [Anaerolineae bacterium]